MTTFPIGSRVTAIRTEETATVLGHEVLEDSGDLCLHVQFDGRKHTNMYLASGFKLASTTFRVTVGEYDDEITVGSYATQHEAYAALGRYVAEVTANGGTVRHTSVEKL